LENDIDSSLVKAEEIQNPFLKALVLCQIVQSSLEGGDSPSVDSAFNQILQISREIAKDPRGKPLIGRLCKTVAQSGQYDKALEAVIWFENGRKLAIQKGNYQADLQASLFLRDKGQADSIKRQVSVFLAFHQSSIFSILASKPEFIVPLLSPAYLILQAVQQQVPIIDDVLIRTEVLISLNKAYLLAEELEREKGITYNLPTGITANLDQILSMAGQITDMDYRVWVLSNLTQDLMRAGKDDQILGIINRIDDPETQALTLEGMAVESIRLGKLEKNIEFLTKALAVAEQFEPMAKKVEILSKLAQDFAQTGDRTRSENILKRTTEDLGQLDNSEIKLRVLFNQAEAFNQLKDYTQTMSVCEQIKRTAATIDDVACRELSFRNTARLLLEANQKDKSRHMLIRTLDHACRISRKDVMSVLFSVLNWISELETPDFPRRAYESIVEIDGWWGRGED
jgi:tetratricopeptide (TPR) repeat protein